ncbi:MAG: hypothetical protein NXY57DRAFT_1039645 [Lentinula lateritia]|nr:MAG: hypothetical protein NXY57DRAFT_1039645 [Lentinula lateritia]
MLRCNSFSLAVTSTFACRSAVIFTQSFFRYSPYQDSSTSSPYLAILLVFELLVTAASGECLKSATESRHQVGIGFWLVFIESGEWIPVFVLCHILVTLLRCACEFYDMNWMLTNVQRGASGSIPKFKPSKNQKGN